jgi:tetratricopeptide (TPR) repeat protein
LRTRSQEAEAAYKEGLDIREKSLHAEHRDIATSVSLLGRLYFVAGRYAEAEPLYLRSLAIWEKALGPDHPYVGTSLRERANLYRDQGKYAAAEPLYIRSLQVFEKSPDENRPNLVETLENYILLLRKMNRTAEAEAAMVARITDKIRRNRDRIVVGISNAEARGVRIAVFPEGALRGTDGNQARGSSRPCPPFNAPPAKRSCLSCSAAPRTRLS